MKLILNSIFFFLLLSNLSFSQIINKWLPVNDLVYSSNIYRTKSFDNNIEKSLAYLYDSTSRHHLVGFYDNIYNKSDVLLRSDIYEYEFLSIAHPKEEYIYVAGDTLEFLGLIDFNERFKRTGMILKSKDKGANWSKIYLDSNTWIRYLDMYNENIGLASYSINPNIFNPLPYEGNKLIYTENGFDSYELLELPIDSANIEFLKMLSTDTFVVLLNSIAHKTRSYFISKDSGRNWSVIDIDAEHNQLYFATETIWYSIRTIENSKTTLWKSTDSGTNWDLFFAPEYASRNNFEISSVSAFDEQSVIVGTNASFFYKSIDGGLSWNKEYPVNNLGYEADMMFAKIRDIEYVNKDLAYALLNSRIIKMSEELALDRPYLHRMKEVHPDSVIITWDIVEGAEYYNYQLAYNPFSGYSYSNFENVLLDTIISGSEFELKGTLPDSCYLGRLKAVGNGIESEWTLRAYHFCTKPEENPLQVPNLIIPLQSQTLSGDNVEIRWNKVNNASSYNIQFTSLPDQKITFLDENTADTVIYVSVSDFAKFQMAYIRIRSFDGFRYSKWVNRPITLDTDISVEIFVNNSNIFIHPNPAEDYIEVNQTSKGSEIRIYNVMGLEVLSESIHPMSLRHRMYVEHLPAGVYFIRIGEQMSMFVKQ